MNTEDTSTSLEVGKINGNLPIETSRSQQGLIQNIHPVGSSNGNYARISIKSIHLHQNLVNSLLPLVISSSKSSTTLTSHGINLIDKDDAGGILFGLREYVTDARGSDTDEHFDEFGTGDRDEGDSCFAGHGFGEKGLT